MRKAMLILALLALPAGAAQAKENPDANVCLKVQNISNTTTPDSRTILFHMRDGSVWRNTLKTHCSGLTWDGFTHNNFGPAEYCGNKEIIHSNTTGAACVLGDFFREPAKKPRS